MTVFSRSPIGRSAVSRELEGCRALVTGASGGIGCAVAVELARRGAQLALVGRSTDRLQAVRAETGGTAAVFRYDLTQPGAPAGLLDDVTALWDGLDILVHCAGVYLQKPIAESRIEDLDYVYLNNVRPPYAVTLRLLDFLRATAGQVVFVSSSIVRAQNTAGRSLYATSQHALRALADGLRDDVNAQGVRVMTVFPGTTATPLSERLFAASGRPYPGSDLLQAADVAEAIGNALCLARTAEITDLHIRPRRKTS